MTPQPLSPGAQNLNWLLANFVQQVPNVRQAVVVSSDGLVLSMSQNLTREEADRFAAVAAGLMGLAHGSTGPVNGGAVHSVVIEMERAFVFVTSISDGSRFAVVANAPCDVGLLAYEMAVFCERAGSVLSPALITELQASLPR